MYSIQQNDSFEPCKLVSVLNVGIFETRQISKPTLPIQHIGRKPHHWTEFINEESNPNWQRMQGFQPVVMDDSLYLHYQFEDGSIYMQTFQSLLENDFIQKETQQLIVENWVQQNEDRLLKENKEKIQEELQNEEIFQQEDLVRHMELEWRYQLEATRDKDLSIPCSMESSIEFARQLVEETNHMITR